MRIISGFHKGRKINAPRNLIARPTTDKAKEAIFNILNNHYLWKNISVLELFSGTGNISFEFASRGVTKILLIENNYRCIEHIKKTMKKLNFQLNAIKVNVFKFLSTKMAYSFDIIFADPPYELNKTKYIEIIDLVFNNKFINDNGVLILEHNGNFTFKDHNKWEFDKKYGSNYFSFFKKKAGNKPDSV